MEKKRFRTSEFRKQVSENGQLKRGHKALFFKPPPSHPGIGNQAKCPRFDQTIRKLRRMPVPAMLPVASASATLKKAMWTTFSLKVRADPTTPCAEKR
jgi:hypothetical protein